MIRTKTRIIANISSETIQRKKIEWQLKSIERKTVNPLLYPMKFVKIKEK